jgi:AraC-like DNA-binding protein
MKSIVYKTTRYAPRDGHIYTRLRRDSDNSPDSLKKEKHFVNYITCFNSDDSGVIPMSAGHDCSRPPRVLSRQSDNRLIIHFVTRGVVRYNETEIHPGQYFFTLPLEKHVIRFSDEDFEMFYITLHGKNLGGFISENNFDKAPQSGDCPFLSKIIPLFTDMIYCKHEDTDLYTYICSSVWQILSYLIHQNETLSSARQSAEKDYVSRAVKIISEKFSHDISVASIASELCISPDYLGNLFREQRGVSPQQMITQFRMELAVSLITSDNPYKLSYIAQTCGYNDYAYFSRMFRKYKGISPSGLRQKFNPNK